MTFPLPWPRPTTLPVGCGRNKGWGTDGCGKVACDEPPGCAGQACDQVTASTCRPPYRGPQRHPGTRLGVISGGILARAWGFLGLISATLVMAGFFLTLRHAGWEPGAATGPGTALNHGYRQATTVAPYPFVVWGADEIRRARVRR